MFNETTPETSFINQVKIENNADGKLDDNNVNTKFNICVIAVYGSKRSDPAVVTNISIKPKGTIYVYNRCIYVILINQVINSIIANCKFIYAI